MTKTPVDCAAVLNAPLREDNDAGAGTVRDYLVQLLATLWQEQEGFSGKRPFGNSGWEYDLYFALVQAGIVPGKIDDDGYLQNFSDKSRKMADQKIAQAIQSLGQPSSS